MMPPIREVPKLLGIRVAGMLLLTALCVACHSAVPRPVVPVDAAMRLVAPDSFEVTFETSRGSIDMLFQRALAPLGVDRVYQLVRSGYYDGSRFYRVAPGFVAQAGMARDPRVIAEWQARPVPIEPVRTSNRRGTVGLGKFPPVGPTSNIYVNLVDNVRLDTANGGYTPIGRVTGKGMAIVDALYGGYGDHPPKGSGPARDSLRLQGEAYLARKFPRLDVISRASVAREWR